MAIADPLTVTVGAVDTIFNRTGFSENGGTFQTLDGLTKLTVTHSTKRRVRHELRIDDRRSVSDPLVPTLNRDVNASVYLVVNAPLAGYTNEDLAEMVTLLCAAMSVGTTPVMEQVIGGQS